MSSFLGGSTERRGFSVLAQPQNELDALYRNLGIDTFKLITQVTFEQPYTYEMMLALEGYRTTHYPKTRMFNYSFINPDFIRGFEIMKLYADYLKNLLDGSLPIPKSSGFDIEGVYFNRDSIISRLIQDLWGEQAFLYMSERVRNNYDPTNSIGAKVREGVVFSHSFYIRNLSEVSNPFLAELVKLHPSTPTLNSMVL